MIIDSHKKNSSVSQILEGTFKNPNNYILASKKDLQLDYSNTKLKAINLTIPRYPESELQYIKKLGEGAQGEVMLYEVMGAKYAVKKMKVDDYESFILKEIAILQKLNHPNVINIMGLCFTPEYYYLLTDYFESYSLYEILFVQKIHLTMQNKNNVVQQILAGLAYLHLDVKNKPLIIHRDLKPANILVNKNFTTKICDMGLSKCN